MSDSEPLFRPTVCAASLIRCEFQAGIKQMVRLPGQVNHYPLYL